MSMTPDNLEKLNGWFMEQIAALKAEGASEQDFEDSSVADLALRKIFEQHFEEIRNDADLTDEIFAVVSDQASPSDLRKVALQAREQCNLGIGYYLELIADYRERQPFQILSPPRASSGPKPFKL
jgi:hypothetical protein